MTGVYILTPGQEQARSQLVTRHDAKVRRLIGAPSSGKTALVETMARSEQYDAAPSFHFVDGRSHNVAFACHNARNIAHYRWRNHYIQTTVIVDGLNDATPLGSLAHIADLTSAPHYVQLLTVEQPRVRWRDAHCEHVADTRRVSLHPPTWGEAAAALSGSDPTMRPPWRKLPPSLALARIPGGWETAIRVRDTSRSEGILADAPKWLEAYEGNN